MDTLRDVLTGIPWYAWIAIVAILGGTITSIVRMTQRHIERMEQIRRGVAPGPETEED